MRIAPALAVTVVSLLAAGVARAEAENEADNTSYQNTAKRRSDFTFGTGGGFALGRASGYPNEIQKIRDSEYLSSTKLGLGSGGLFWLGVAFNDYLTFGLAVGGFSLSGNGRDASVGLYGFHIDAFPLAAYGANLRDLGVFTNLGTGPLKIKGGPEEADGGLLAYVEGGVVYERWRLWRIGFGPTVSLVHVWSDSAEATSAMFGGRLAFYGGP
ncbi:MAG: hypothetical protein K0R38_4156 [Polyangiaceae bacterium]|jgi:hypothetical protein|nr:hypothetical protein [Polyangiaceae bacterium]